MKKIYRQSFYMRKFKKYSWILYVLLLVCLTGPIAVIFQHGIISPDTQFYFAGIFISALIGLLCVTLIKNNKLSFGTGALTSAFSA
jgi:hypothetical protein